MATGIREHFWLPRPDTVHLQVSDLAGRNCENDDSDDDSHSGESIESSGCESASRVHKADPVSAS